MTILYGFKLDDKGRMMDRLFDLDKMPSDWYDSPDKVPGAKKPEVVETLAKIIPEAATPVAPDKPRRGRPPKNPDLIMDPRFAKPKAPHV